ncbi:hypothetical protein PSHT_13383 [Puccinia striiformis]|uniref:Uncharacterized protein n=2 Tax=Puccinia striiformis TaxID=27350 RepID=A0A2S4URD1_9BASI|nr:hypothetical protein PSHT_13383 [Puccinia striiformis]
MIFPVLVPLILPISNEQIAASSLLPVAGADSGRLIGQQGESCFKLIPEIVEHCIPITSEGTPAPGRIQSSQDNSVTRLDYPSEMGHRIGIPNQGSRSARLEQGPEDVMMGCIGECLSSPDRGLRIDNVNGTRLGEVGSDVQDAWLIFQKVDVKQCMDCLLVNNHPQCYFPLMHAAGKTKSKESQQLDLMDNSYESSDGGSAEVVLNPGGEDFDEDNFVELEAKEKENEDNDFNDDKNEGSATKPMNGESMGQLICAMGS